MDRDDKVKYFSQAKDRIFQRNRAILNRDVRLCHPPASAHIVDKIIEDFKSTNLDSIKNIHKTVSIENIDKLIKYYENKKINLHDKTLKKEIEALSKILFKNLSNG